MRILAALSSLSVLFAASGYAAVFDCSDAATDVTGNVTGTDGCQYSDALGNDTAAGVNAEGFFGFTDWQFAVRDNDLDGVDEGTNTFGFALTGSQQQGSWSFDEPLVGFDVMLIFKGGNSLPSRVVAYIVDASLGDYDTPFSQPRNGNSQAISHMSVYFRPSDNFQVQAVPVPAGGLLMGGGVLLFAFHRKALQRTVPLG